MERFLTNLKADLDEISETQPMITVKRSDSEALIAAYEKRAALDAEERQIVGKALRYWESEFGMTNKESALLGRLQGDSEGV